MDKKSGGFTLIELIVVIAMLGTIAAIAVPRLEGFKSKAEESVCVANRKTVERMYSVFLVKSDIDYEESTFNQFLIDNFYEVCPVGGTISYEEGKMMCDVHGNENVGEDDNDPGEEVPWL